MLLLIPYLVVAFIYLAVAFDCWRIAKLNNTLNEQARSLKLHSAMIALALLMHARLLYVDIFAVGSFNFGLFYAISAILWLTVLIYWLANLKHKIDVLQCFVLPPAALFVLLSALSIHDYIAPYAETYWFMAHVGIAILAYSLFTFAAMHAVLMAIAERNLHQKTTFIQLPSFPPLMVMESLLFNVITLGFTLLTLIVGSGMLFSEQIFGKPLEFSHKVVFSIASWFIYAGLLYGRHRYGWRGLKAIRWTLAGFGLLALSYIGSRVVLELLLHRQY